MEEVEKIASEGQPVVVQNEQVSQETEYKQHNSFDKLLVYVVFLVVLLFLAGLFLFSFNEQKNRKKEIVYHVGILSGINLFSPIAESFKKEMKNLGYVEGKNMIYDYRKTNYEPDKEKQILEEFVKNKVDMIFCYNTEVALAAKQATIGTNIPVVFANSFTEGTELVGKTNEPGGNITGVRYPGQDVIVKRYELLREMLPSAKRIYLPYQKGYPYVSSQLELLRKLAEKENITLITFSSQDVVSLESELEKRSKSDDIGFDAVLLIPEALSTNRTAFNVLAKYTRAKKIPIVGPSITTDDYGTLFAVTIDPLEMGKLGANLAAKILQGETAGTIPVVTPSSIIKINTKIAEELDISIAEEILLEANELIY